MDIENLNRSQIVLLTLFVSFVTSIATGIVTVSLMQQAPPAVAQTINRVIEHTIETVVATSTSKSQAATPAVIQQKTVIVNESDMVAQAVKRIAPSVVRIYSNNNDGTGDFLGLGVVLDASGTVVSDIDAFGDYADARLVLADGSSVRAFVTSRDQASGMLYLTPATSTAGTPAWVPVSIVTNPAQLGDSVVEMSGEKDPQIAAGLVTRLIQLDSLKGQSAIATNIGASMILSGSPLFTTDGALIGVSTGVSRASSPSGFVPATEVHTLALPQK